MMLERNNNSVKFKTRYKSDVQENCKKSTANFYWKCLPAIVAFVCYVNGLTGDFVHDDVFAIKKNPDVHGKTSLLKLFQNDFWGKPMVSNTSHKSYRPLTVLTFRLNYELSGGEPYFFHVINVILHSCVTYLLTSVCQQHFRLTLDCSIMVGLLFAVHPIHTEAVTGIVGRAELLAGLLFLVCFICYNRSLGRSLKYEFPVVENQSYFVLSILAAISAMLCKETGITALAVCLLFDCLVHCRSGLLRMLTEGSVDVRCKPLVCRIITVVAVTLCVLSWRVWIMGGTLPQFLEQDNPASFSPSLMTRVLSYHFTWCYNIWLLLAPANQCYDWQVGSIPLVESCRDSRNLATVAFYTVACTLIYIMYSHFKRKSNSIDPVVISLIFLVLPFLPASNLFFHVGFVLAERVLYIPSIGFCLCVGVGAHKLISRWRHLQPVVMTMFILLLLMHAGKTWRQNRLWLSRESLFKSGIEAMPHNAKVHYNYANFLRDSGRDKEAIVHYKTTLRLAPDYASCHNNIGTLLENKTEAEFHFRETLHLRPFHQKAHVNLGNALMQRGEHEEGVRYLQRALELDSDSIEGLTSLGTALAELGNFSEAEQLFKTVIAKQPDFLEVYAYYGLLLRKMGRLEESAKYYKKAIKSDSHKSGSLANAAYVYREMGDYGKAEELLKQSIAVRRDQNVLEELAMVYFHTGRKQESISLYDEINRLSSNSTETMLRYGKLLGSTDQWDRAVTVFQQVLTTEPYHLEALKHLGYVSSRQGQNLQSVDYLSRAIQVAKTAGDQHVLTELYYEQGISYKNLDMLEQAADSFQAIVDLDETHSDGHGNLGAIYHMTGDIEKAQKHYRLGLKYNPDSEILKQNLEKLNRLARQKQLGLV